MQPVNSERIYRTAEEFINERVEGKWLCRGAGR